MVITVAVIQWIRSKGPLFSDRDVPHATLIIL